MRTAHFLILSSAKRELLINGDFSAGDANWILHDDTVGTMDASSGQMVVTAVTNATRVYQIIPTIIGRNYRARGEIVSVSGGGFGGVRKADNVFATLNGVDLLTGSPPSTGLFDEVFPATATSTYIIIQRNSSSITVDDLSVV